MASSFAVLFNLLAFIATIYFNKQASTISKLFPKKTGEISKRHTTEVSPASSTFVIWAFIYLFQAAWIIYSVSLLFRSGDEAHILPTSFYVFYSCSCLLNSTWLVLWAHEKLALSSLVLVFITATLQACLFIAYQSLDQYLQKVPEKLQSQTDIWCMRILVQNGIMFYAAWVTIATCINFCIYLQSCLHLRKSKAGAIALSALLVIVALWFALENTVFEKYTRYTFSEYIVLLVALNGILKKQWTDGHGNQAFALVIFILAGLMFAARLMIITMKEKYYIK